eukprot:COSAG05_NODE_2669_length_2780_cov_1.727815_3_plen_328_part_00
MEPEPEPEPEQPVRSDEKLCQLLTGAETQEPITEGMFDVLSALVDAPSDAWITIKRTKNMEVRRSDHGGVVKFLTIMSESYGKGIPLAYASLGLRDDAFFVSMVDEIDNIENIGKNEGGNDILHTTMDLPIIKNRDMVVMRAFRESNVPEAADAAGVGGRARFEMLERSTTHGDCPIQLSSKETGVKRKYIRAYQFAYSRIEEAPGDPGSHLAIGASALPHLLARSLAALLTHAPLPPPSCSLPPSYHLREHMRSNFAQLTASYQLQQGSWRQTCAGRYQQAWSPSCLRRVQTWLRLRCGKAFRPKWLPMVCPSHRRSSNEPRDIAS